MRKLFTAILIFVFFTAVAYAGEKLSYNSSQINQGLAWFFANGTDIGTNGTEIDRLLDIINDLQLKNTDDYDSIQAGIEALDGANSTLVVGASGTVSALTAGTYKGVTIYVPKGITLTIDNDTTYTSNFVVEDGGQVSFSSNATLNGTVQSRGYTSEVVPLDGSTTITLNGALIAGKWKVFGSSLTITGDPEVDEIYPEWFGAVGDESTDDTDAVQAALDLANGRNEVVKLSGKGYLVSGVKIYSYTQLIGSNTGTSFLKLKDSSEENVIRSSGWDAGETSTRIKIQDLLVKGNKSNNTNGSCIALKTKYSTIDNVIVNNCPEHGFHLEGNSTTNGINNIIKNSQAHNSGKDGLYVTNSATDGIVSDCYFGNNDEDQINITPGSWQVNNCHLYAGTTTNGTGMRLQGSSHMIQNVLFDKIPRECIVIDPSSSQKAYLFNNIYLRDCSSKTNATYSAVSFDISAGTYLRMMSFNNVHVGKKLQDNIVDDVFHKVDGVVHLNVNNIFYGDYNGSLHNLTSADNDRWHFISSWRNNRPSIQRGTDTIADTSATKGVSTIVDASSAAIQVTPHGEASVWISDTNSSGFTVSRNGTSGTLDFSWEVYNGEM